MKWFPKNATGLKADLRRHKLTEEQLVDLIKYADDLIVRQTLEGLLAKLRQSKAELAQQIGAKR